MDISESQIVIQESLIIFGSKKALLKNFKTEDWHEKVDIEFEIHVKPK